VSGVARKLRVEYPGAIYRRVPREPAAKYENDTIICDYAGLTRLRVDPKFLNADGADAGRTASMAWFRYGIFWPL
jgi:hypothetical protein